ncbi:hypothetical protein E2562_038643 [Oryza meyeriana var. granulata]|uniref:Uncharacterized protein n=1 Tax=Oryza meyeriana var. granulata TaxID=110450 RepID=A0A6G1E8K2_9ORYZ|nr:hypothetical protein E2562_038643 [Oryza meyeriana var. granulata]
MRLLLTDPVVWHHIRRPPSSGSLDLSLCRLVRHATTVAQEQKKGREARELKCDNNSCGTADPAASSASPRSNARCYVSCVGNRLLPRGEKGIDEAQNGYHCWFNS